jgi:cation diffusion facilitator CzcD-associated flavoprotein CzcO
MTTKTPAVVIGAGPYGLSVAAHLSARGSQPRVFGEVMSSWRSHMPAGMCLKSTPDASSLSAAKPGYRLADYCTSVGIRPLRDENDDIIPVELFSRYGQWFAEQLVPQVEQAVVTHVEPAGRGFVVSLDTGEEILTPTVVVATGVSHVDYVPDELAALAPGGQPAPDAAVSHTSQHRSLTGFRDRRVAVIGAGQSALESAALLHEAGADVTVLVRRTARFGTPPAHPTGLAGMLPQPHSPLGPTWRIYPFSHAPGYFHYLPEETRLKLVRRVLRDRVEGVLPVLNEHAVRQASVDSGGVLLSTTCSDGQHAELRVDHVMAATGYRIDLAKLGFLETGLRQRIRLTGTFPELSRSFESSQPGLYFVGLSAAATFGPVMRFVCGAGFAAHRVAAAAAPAG